MDSANKVKVALDYSRLSEDVQEQIKLVYPEGYSQHLMHFTNQDGRKVSALRFETDEKIYLVRMSVEEAEQIIADDDDFDDEGLLKEEVKDDYEDKHSDVEYLTDNENYQDPE